MCLAIPGQILEITDEDNRLARVDVVGVRRTVNIGLLDVDDRGARPGEWVLIHVGFALSRIDEEEAAATLRLLCRRTTVASPSPKRPSPRPGSQRRRSSRAARLRASPREAG